MQIIVGAQQEIVAGNGAVIESPSPGRHFVAVFEDDGETGYFYALDTASKGGAIEDVLHIYDADDLAGDALPRLVSIAWSADSRHAALLVDGCPHGVFDFAQRKGCCRSGFPPVAADSNWSQTGHAWDQEAATLFERAL